MENCPGSPFPKNGSPTERDRLPPSICSVDSFKSVWAVSAETINFLHWWAFFIGTKYIWSGFRKGHSIITALLGIRDDLRAMKRGEVSLMVFADYSEAFDTVCFKTVLTKMYALGFSNEFLTWMVHYLSDRRLFVQIDKSSSIETVLQGSKLRLYRAHLRIKISLCD